MNSSSFMLLQYSVCYCNTVCITAVQCPYLQVCSFPPIKQQRAESSHKWVWSSPEWAWSAAVPCCVSLSSDQTVRVFLSVGHGLSDGRLVRPQPHCHQLHHHGEYWTRTGPGPGLDSDWTQTRFRLLWVDQFNVTIDYYWSDLKTAWKSLFCFNYSVKTFQDVSKFSFNELSELEEVHWSVNC